MPTTPNEPAALADLTLGAFLDRLAERTPAPGGGAVAGVQVALGAAAAAMVVRYSIGRPALAEHQSVLEAHAEALDRLRKLALTLSDEDAQAYAHLSALRKLPKDDPARAAIPEAALQAAQVPLAVLAAGADLLARLTELPPITNPYLHSDLAIAGLCAEAGSRAAAWNVRVNIPGLPPEQGAPLESQASGLLVAARERAARLARELREPGA
jgi:formiminotetrahydrofolate cyclodeaminase